MKNILICRVKTTYNYIFVFCKCFIHKLIVYPWHFDIHRVLGEYKANHGRVKENTERVHHVFTFLPSFKFFFLAWR